MKRLITIITVLVLIIVLFIIYSFNISNKNNDLTKVKVAEVTHSVFYAPQYVE